MLYVIHGTDIATARQKAHSLLDSLKSKRPDAATVHINNESWDPSSLESHLGGQGLFSNKYIVFLDRVTENLSAKDDLAGFVPAMQESSNIFIILEGKVLVDLKRSFTKHAEKIVDCEEKPTLTKKTEFNVFALGDALGARDPFKAWSAYRQAIDSGIEPENIAGTLFWQIKSMALASNAATASGASLNPFVFGKSKKYAANYSPEELRLLSASLITLYHDAHRGVTDLELSLERLLLNCRKSPL